jgi:hypothetical protein
MQGLEPTGHQNLLVIDKHNPTIEFYDPNGSEYHHMRVMENMTIRVKFPPQLNIITAFRSTDKVGGHL